MLRGESLSNEKKSTGNRIKNKLQSALKFAKIIDIIHMKSSKNIIGVRILGQ